MFYITSVVILELLLVPIPWLYEYKMKNVNHIARDHCITYHTAYGAMAYANYTNDRIIHQT